ncbi:MAG: DEAD/DEAH box helicase family protein [Longibaculum sp.]
MLNFDFLKTKNEFKDFADACVLAEKSIESAPESCVIHSRRALELCVRWIFINDYDLRIPYKDNLSALVHESTFMEIIDSRLIPMMEYIIRTGNKVVHTNKKVSRDEAILSLHNLYQVVEWIDYTYADDYTATKFDESILPQEQQLVIDRKKLAELEKTLQEKDKALNEIIEENKKLRIQGKNKRKTVRNNIDYDVDTLPEWKTRKIYIDNMLEDVGWDFDKNIVREMEVKHMPFGSHKGFVDYVLMGKNGKPIAVVEAKKTIVDPHVGKHQAHIYADCIEKEWGQRPVIFYTNGFETYIWDDTFYPERKISNFLTQDEIQLLISRRKSRKSILSPVIDDNITNRYYQKEAITRVCEVFEAKQRKALLVMATGSGKTRVSISLVDVLIRNNWVKNVLFLADRTELVRQAKQSFVDLLPSLSVCNLLENKDDPETSRMIFSTYPTMMNAIDSNKTKDGKRLFTPGHFDLIILDESHRSIYNRYQLIFDYFDAFLVGLTATPKEDIGKNTYSIFNLQNKVPTYAYEYEQAVDDKYLVPFHSYEIETELMADGIKYDELSQVDKDHFEETFGCDEGEIDANQINKTIFNNETIRNVLQELMDKGIKVEDGDKLGKTIIFASNDKHARAIEDVFNELYPEYAAGHFAQVITYSVNYAQDLIDKFKIKNAYPQIAISVDMLDTGIDVPEVVNLVFFKKVRSKAKFWQMLGRGTRICNDLFGLGENKKSFLIFDCGHNLEYFGNNPNPPTETTGINISQRIFNFKVDILKELQSLKYQNNEEYNEFSDKIVNEILDTLNSLNEDAFYVKLNLRYVHKYKNKDNLLNLGELDVRNIKEFLSPLVIIKDNDEIAKRFDAKLYAIELSHLFGNYANREIKEVMFIARELYDKHGNKFDVKQKEQYIVQAKDGEFWKQANLTQIDKIREELRALAKYIEMSGEGSFYYTTHFTDQLKVVKEGKVFYNTIDLESYKEKVEHYITEHIDNEIIAKIRQNEVVTKEQLKELENIFWIELGNENDYRIFFGDTPIIKLIRKIVGLSQETANQAFSQFINDNRLSSQQIHFIKLIIDYVVKNGFIEDKRVLTEEPFKTVGSMSVLFKDNMNIAREVLKIVDTFSQNFM